jgi:hypothetical protein
MDGGTGVAHVIPMRSLLVALVLLAPITAHAQVHVDIDINVHVPPPPPPPPPPPTPVAVVAAPPTVVVETAKPSPPAPRPSIPATFGIGLTVASGHVINEGNSEGVGVSAILHPVVPFPVEVSIDYERDAFDSADQRVDHRIGYSLYFGPSTGRLSPFVVIPMGVNIVTRAELDTKVEGYIGIGVGAKLRFGDWFASADARVLTRSESPSQDETMVLPSEVVLEGHATVGYIF